MRIPYELAIECIRARYLICQAGGMASKSIVEDVVMMRDPAVTRLEAREAMNDIEYYNWDNGITRRWPAEYGDQPLESDWPQIFQVGARFYKKGGVAR